MHADVLRSNEIILLRCMELDWAVRHKTTLSKYLFCKQIHGVFTICNGTPCIRRYIYIGDHTHVSHPETIKIESHKVVRYALYARDSTKHHLYFRKQGTPMEMAYMLSVYVRNYISHKQHVNSEEIRCFF